jgi:hypothetical protein
LISPVDRYTWVTPELVSYVSRDVESEHLTPEVTVSAMMPRTSVRMPVAAVLAKGNPTGGSVDVSVLVALDVVV